MTHKITWIGPDRYIPDLGITAKTGDTIEIPSDLELGGEGFLWKPKKAAAKKPKPAKED